MINIQSKYAYLSLFLVAKLLPLETKSQFMISGQLRTRTEYRDGFGTLRPKSSTPSIFTSQRTRISFNYKTGSIVFHSSLQDVRVWGQDASTISSSDGNKLGMHEGWAQIMLAGRKDTVENGGKGPDYFGVKLGRQELLYDDSRLLGNLDWLQQARRHDAIVLLLVSKGWRIDLGNAFNQHTDAFNYNGTYYTPANVSPYVKDSKGNLAITPAGMIPYMNSAGWSAKNGSPAITAMPSTNGLSQNYKALQFLYAARSFGSAKLSGLVVADHFGRYGVDSSRNIAGRDTGFVFGKRFNKKGVSSRFTSGILLNAPLDKAGKFLLTTGFYYQAGRDPDAFRINAYTLTLSLAHTVGKLGFTTGWDLLSGNDAFSSSQVNNRFDPLYGTPHKFWGSMDYFYAGTGSPAGGLSNLYFKTKLSDRKKRYNLSLDYHFFALANKQKDLNGQLLPKYLGSEIDLVASYALNKFTSIEFGASLMAATSTMEYAKNVLPGSTNLTAFWSFLMINVTPSFL